MVKIKVFWNPVGTQIQNASGSGLAIVLGTKLSLSTVQCQTQSFPCKLNTLKCTLYVILCILYNVNLECWTGNFTIHNENYFSV